MLAFLNTKTELFRTMGTMDVPAVSATQHNTFLCWVCCVLCSVEVGDSCRLHTAVSTTKGSKLDGARREQWLSGCGESRKGRLLPSDGRLRAESDNGPQH